MKEDAEDLYLKGFMAHSSKNDDEAATYWNKVLEIDPNHSKAREGLAKINKGALRVSQGKSSGKYRVIKEGQGKQSSKELFGELKRLYREQYYSAALEICEELLRRHPNQKELRGTCTKIEQKLQTQQEHNVENLRAGLEDITVHVPQPAHEEIEISSEDALEPSLGGSDDGSEEIEQLIQKGVSLYEVENYEDAIRTWRKALNLEPGNPIAQEYIANVKSMLGKESEEEPKPAPQVKPPAQPIKPSKEELIKIYNKGKSLFHGEQFVEAIEEWNKILRHHPNHKETLQCVERAKRALKDLERFHATLEQANQALAENRLAEAERLYTQLTIEAPELLGLHELKEGIAAKQRENIENADTTELSVPTGSLELEGTLESNDGPALVNGELEENSLDDVDAGENVEPLPKPESKPRKGAKLKGAVSAKRHQKMISWAKLGRIAVVTAGIAILGVLGFKGFQLRQRQLQAENKEQIMMPLVSESNWDSEFEQSLDFSAIGNTFALERAFIFAALAYQRSFELADIRLSAIGEHNVLTIELEKEKVRLEQIFNQAKADYHKNRDLIKPEKYGPQELARANAEIKRKEYESASIRLMAILSTNMDDARIREKLGNVQEKLAFQYLAEKNLNQAAKHFQRAAVLKHAFTMNRRHKEVIQRFFQGQINEVEKDRWFFFFQS